MSIAAKGDTQRLIVAAKATGKLWKNAINQKIQKCQKQPQAKVCLKKKIQPGLSFSSAVVRNPLTVELQPAQRRMEVARTHTGQANAGNLTNENQLVSDI